MGLLSKGSGWKRDWVAIDEEGNVAGFDLESPDHHIYQVDDNWDGTYDGLSNYEQIGWQIPGWKDYTIGQPCYYLGAVTNVSYSIDGYTVRGSQALMYGKKTVTKMIDSNFQAVLHYYFGDGKPIMLGNMSTKNALLRTEEFETVLQMKANSQGNYSIDMTDYMFHIGNTQLFYYRENGYSIFSLGINDGFWDPRFIREWCYNHFYRNKSSNRRNSWATDGKGPNLEFKRGVPYDYIPLVFMQTNNK